MPAVTHARAGHLAASGGRPPSHTRGRAVTWPAPPPAAAHSSSPRIEPSAFSYYWNAQLLARSLPSFWIRYGCPCGDRSLPSAWMTPNWIAHRSPISPACAFTRVPRHPLRRQSSAPAFACGVQSPLHARLPAPHAPRFGVLGLPLDCTRHRRLVLHVAQVYFILAIHQNPPAREVSGQHVRLTRYVARSPSWRRSRACAGVWCVVPASPRLLPQAFTLALSPGHLSRRTTPLAHVACPRYLMTEQSLPAFRLRTKIACNSAAYMPMRLVFLVPYRPTSSAVSAGIASLARLTRLTRSRLWTTRHRTGSPSGHPLLCRQMEGRNGTFARRRC